MSDGLPPSMSAILAPPAQPEASVFTEQPQRRVQFLTTGVTPPSDLYIAPDDSIRIELFSETPGILIHVKIRFVSALGDMMYEEEQLFTTTLPATASQDYRLGEGFLLSVALSADLNNNARGRVFASVSYIRAFGSAQSSYMLTLVQGYVAGLQRVSWPVIQTDWSTNGMGLIDFRSFGSQAVGQPWSFTTANQVRTRLMSCVVVLQTSATVGNRNAYLLAQLGGINYVNPSSPTAQVASTSGVYTFAPGFQTMTGATPLQTVQWPIDLLLPGGTMLQFSAFGLQATDQITSAALATEEWMDL